MIEHLRFEDADTHGDEARLTFVTDGEPQRIVFMRLDRHKLAAMIRTLEGIRFALDAKAGE